MTNSNSLEKELHQKGLKYAYYDLKEKQNQNFYMFFADFNTWLNPPELKADYSQIFDSVIFIDKVKPATKKE